MPSAASPNQLAAEIKRLSSRLAKLEHSHQELKTQRKHRPNDMMLPKSIGPDLIDLESFMPSDSVMPITPVAGQLWRYPTGINGSNWLFQWDEDTDAWYFIGGSPIRNSVDTNETTAGTFGNLATVGPQLTLPFDGYYNVQCGAYINGTPGGGQPFTGSMSYNVGGSGAAVNLAATANSFAQGGMSVASPFTVVLASASDSVLAKYQDNSGGLSTVYFAYRWLAITPILVA